MALTNFASPLTLTTANMKIGGSYYLSHPFGYTSHMKTAYS